MQKARLLPLLLLPSREPHGQRLKAAFHILFAGAKLNSCSCGHLARSPGCLRGFTGGQISVGKLVEAQ